MNRFILTLFFFVSVLGYLAPAQAMLDLDSAFGTCQVFAEDESNGGAGEDGSTGTQEEEEEPDCE